jgi:RNA polymerase sigma-70 factor (ECF subfamily)
MIVPSIEGYQTEMKRPDLTTEDLARKAREGDRDAMEALAERTYPGLLSAARAYGRRKGGLRARIESGDLAQSAYHDALRALPRYEPRGVGSFRRWLLGVLRNKVRRRLASILAHRRDIRQESRLPRDVPAASQATSPLGRLLDGEHRTRLAESLAGLSDRHRRVIHLRYHEGLPWRDVGTRLGISEEAAQMLCHRALVDLNEAFFTSAPGAVRPRRPA